MSFWTWRKNEITKVALTWTMSALLSIGYAIGWSAVHSMLVKRMGVEYLPYTYIGISLLGVFGSSVYLMFADAVRRDRLLMLFSGGTAILLLLARTLVTANPEGEKGLTLPLLLFFSAVFFAQGVGNSTLGTQVWTIISDLFTPSQGRRLYPIIGTAGTIGGIAGGASIHALASRLGTANLVLIWAATLWLLIPLAWYLKKRFGGELRGSQKSKREEGRAVERLKEGWQFFSGSRMAVILGLIAVMFWVVGSLGDFQFTRIMNATYPSEAKLAGFYGIYGMLINASGLFVQIFFGGYLIRRIGVSKGLCALPVTALFGFAAVIARFSFWPGLWLRCSWDLMGMTLQGNSYQLALNAIPSALRARVRGFIEGVINPMGGVLGGVLILVLHQVFKSNASLGWRDPISLAGIALSALWFVAVLRSQKSYMDLVAGNLHSREARTVMDAIDCLEEPGNARAQALLDEVSRMPEPERRSAAARVRGHLGGPEAMKALGEACRDSEPQVRLEAVRALAHLSKKTSLAIEALDLLKTMVESDPEPRVRGDALKLMLLHQQGKDWQETAQRWIQGGSAPVRARVVESIGLMSEEKRSVLEPFLKDESPLVQAAAIQALWPEEGARPAARESLVRLLTSKDEECLRAAFGVCHRIGECPTPSAGENALSSQDKVLRLLSATLVIRFSDQAETLQSKALQAIRDSLSDERCAETLQAELLPLLPDLGEEALDAILLATADLPEAQRIQASKVLGGWYEAARSQLSLREL